MTTEQIRKNIKVAGYSISQIGIYITYFSGDNLNFHKTLDLPPLQAITALKAIGSIDKIETNPTRIYWESPKGASCDAEWELFCNTFTLSQYEAITLVLRHEYEESLKNDMNLFEIDEALRAIKH